MCMPYSFYDKFGKRILGFIQQAQLLKKLVNPVFLGIIGNYMSCLGNQLLYDGFIVVPHIGTIFPNQII